MGVVIGHGAAVDSQYGPEAEARLRTAMEQAIRDANAEGIPNDEVHASEIAQRMQAAYQRELSVIMREVAID